MASGEGGGRDRESRLAEEIERNVWLLWGAALGLLPAELATVLLRTDPSARELLNYVAVSVCVTGWLALLVAAAGAAFHTLGRALLSALRLPGRLAAALSIVASGLSVGAIGVLTIAPWTLRNDPLRFAVSLPLASVLGSAVVHWLRSRWPRAALFALLWPGCLGVTLVNAFVYRGLYVTLHRGLLWFAWITLAFALSSLWRVRPPARQRLAPLVLLVSAHLAVLDSQSARELGVLHGLLEPTASGVLRALSDRDGDGYARLWGGGDCDDADAQVFPGACEQPANGRDDNCNGSSDPTPPLPATEELRALRSPLPDVYVIVIDTLRSDFGGPGRAVGSPTLEALARRSLDFSRAYAAYPATFRSLGAMLESRSPRTYGPEHADFVSELVRVGYDAQLWMAAQRTQIGVRGRAWPPSFSEHPFKKYDASHPAARDWSAAILRDAVAELARDGGPRLRWLHLLDLHGPWLHAPRAGSLQERYLAEVRHVENLLRPLFSALSSAPRGREAVIIVLGDHGEQLGEHGATFHDAFVWEESIRVPLVMHLPGAAARRIDTPASLLDVAPTLLHYLGIAQPASFEGHDWLRHPERRALPPAAEVGESALGPWGPPARHAVIGERYKLSLNVSENLFELYDLESDPGENRPLRREGIAEARALLRELARYQDRPGCRLAK